MSPVDSVPGPRAELRFSGRLTADGLDALLDAYTRALGTAGEGLLLDFSGLTSLDPGGASLLVKLCAWAESRSQKVLAFGLSLPVGGVFQLTGLESAMALFATRSDARAGAALRLAPAADAPEPGWAPITGAATRATGPLHGFGPLWETTHRVRLPGCPVDAAGVIERWRSAFAELWPEGTRAELPAAGLAPGVEVSLHLGWPSGLPLAAGAVVLHAEERSFTLATLPGHVQAGWITFSACEEDGVPVAQVRSLARVSDPLYEAGLLAFGRLSLDAFWHRVLALLAARFGLDAVPQSTWTCIDPRRRWLEAANARSNEGLKTLAYGALGVLGRVLRPLRP